MLQVGAKGACNAASELESKDKVSIRTPVASVAAVYCIEPVQKTVEFVKKCSSEANIPSDALIVKQWAVANPRNPNATTVIPEVRSDEEAKGLAHWVNTHKGKTIPLVRLDL